MSAKVHHVRSRGENPCDDHYYAHCDEHHAEFGVVWHSNRTLDGKRLAERDRDDHNQSCHARPMTPADQDLERVVATQRHLRVVSPEREVTERDRLIGLMSDDAMALYGRLLTLHASVGVGAGGQLDQWTAAQLEELSDIAATLAAKCVAPRTAAS